ncbi:sialate O-acetylesterase [Sphingomonas oligophenolica]
MGALTLLTACAAAPAAAASDPAGRPVFARVFSDHAVLQRDRPITVWGSADPAQQLSVTLGNSTVALRADKTGHWRTRLPAMAAGGPYTLTVSGAGGTTTLADIKLGDVYLCGGQSNMEFPARLSTGSWNGIVAAPNDDMRFLTIAHDSEPAPLDDLKHPAAWQIVAPDTVGDASAVCYYMARSLQKTEKVPIGFIHSSWGGTTIQSWIGAASLRSYKPFEQGVAAVSLMASNPAEAMAREGQKREAWWDAHDPDAAAQRAWIAPGYDDSAWSSMVPAGSWKEAGIPALADFDGVAWFRTTVTLTEAQAKAANRLALGPIDTYDTAWVNGVRVGSGSIAWVWRDYEVPAGAFRAGPNVIVLRVLSGGQGGGLTGQPKVRGIGTADGQFIPIASPWRYKMGMRARGLSIASSPWAVPTSLTTLYNGMIAPLAGYGFKLAAWYQGEANADKAAEYRTLLPLLMRDWRKNFAQPYLPFLVVQLTSYGAVAASPGKSDWAALREAQAQSVAADPHAGLVVTIDVGDRTDIHPSQKAVVGERLARAARAVAYGEPVTPGGPEAVGVVRSGNDLVVRFKNINGGLRTYSANVAIGFEACIADRCSYVPGTIQSDSVVLGGANRPEVTRVRYAWADAPFVNLYSADDLPAAPFELPVPQGS